MRGLCQQSCPVVCRGMGYGASVAAGLVFTVVLVAGLATAPASLYLLAPASVFAAIVGAAIGTWGGAVLATAVTLGGRSARTLRCVGAAAGVVPFALPMAWTGNDGSLIGLVVLGSLSGACGAAVAVRVTRGRDDRP